MDKETLLLIHRIKADLAGEGNILGKFAAMEGGRYEEPYWYKRLIEDLRAKGIDPEDVDQETLEAIWSKFCKNSLLG